MKIHKNCSRILHETFSCIHCTNVYHTKSGLVEHVQIVHHDKQLHECYCGSRHQSAYALRTHLDNNHNTSKLPKERNFICQSCGKGKECLLESFVLNCFNTFFLKRFYQKINSYKSYEVSFKFSILMR